jgi:hypothetical protein
MPSTDDTHQTTPGLAAIGELLMLLVVRSAEYSGTREEAAERRAQFRQRYGDPKAAYERFKAEAARHG